MSHSIRVSRDALVSLFLNLHDVYVFAVLPMTIHIAYCSFGLSIYPLTLRSSVSENPSEGPVHRYGGSVKTVTRQIILGRRGSANWHQNVHGRYIVSFPVQYVYATRSKGTYNRHRIRLRFRKQLRMLPLAHVAICVTHYNM